MTRISRQRFLRLYDGLCGMTGTASGSEREFRDVYRVPVVAIPTRQPCRRQMLPTRFFRDEVTKVRSAAAEIQEIRKSGRPVLVGTPTIAISELMAAQLNHLAVPFQLLNGKQDADEAAIIANAGQMGTITIATNMAGRGTDIRLGKGVAAIGGLFVLGMERHTCNRVDRQLAGRAARQGDPGSCRFLVSADDTLIQRFAPELADALKRSAEPSGEVHGDFERRVAQAQSRATQLQVEQRRQLLVQGDWMCGVLNTLTSRASNEP